ncbi:hypothetical protein SRB17_83360 [Streptomyces sp. RB17]|nr:hypothetical protein [Streptomyces sp. RB17]
MSRPARSADGPWPGTVRRPVQPGYRPGRAKPRAVGYSLKRAALQITKPTLAAARAVNREPTKDLNQRP